MRLNLDALWLLRMFYGLQHLLVIVIFTPVCFIFLGLLLQSRVLCKQNIHAFDVFDIVVDEVDVLWRRRALKRLAEVQEIDLSYRGIYSRPIFGFVESLDLRGFCSLCKLDLSHNQLYELPKAIGSLRSLTHLFLNDNYLPSLQLDFITLLVNLQELDLRNNKLNDFSLDITELSCLRRLSVQGNPLKDDETRKLMKLANNERWIDIAGECKIL